MHCSPCLRMSQVTSQRASHVLKRLPTKYDQCRGPDDITASHSDPAVNIEHFLLRLLPAPAPYAKGITFSI